MNDNIKVGICRCHRHYTPSYIYKTIVLKPNYCCRNNKNILTQEQLSEKNVKYVIKYNFSLDGETITVPENCILEFDGGSLSNGTIVGQDTVFINVGDVDIWGENLTREGTWREHSGGGGGEQVQSDWNETDEESKAYIRNKPTLFSFITPEQYGAKGDGVTDDTQAFQDCIDAVHEAGGGDIVLDSKTYIVEHIDLKVKTNLIGQGQGNTILKALTDGEANEGIINIPLYGTLCKISDLSVVGSDVNEGGVIRHTNKNGIHIQYGAYENAIAGTSNRWQENRIDPSDVDETKTQTYRDIIIQNVYVGKCNYGIKCENQAYRVSIAGCDVKYCNYGIHFPITDSSIDNCYIEGCKYSGFISTGANNKISKIKSIWNGAGDIANSYGLQLRGARNEVTDCEAQDNYCSGIIVTGEENVLTNIISNTNGFIKSEGELTPEELNIDTCEWYINTMTTVFNNCVATGYANRNNGHFPKHAILYGAAHEDFGSRVKIMATQGTPIARNPIVPDVPIGTSCYFPFKLAQIDFEKGYLIGDNIIVGESKVSDAFTNTINIAAITEFIPQNITAKETLFRYSEYLSLTVSKPANNILRLEDGYTNVYPVELNLSYIDFNKPVRCLIRSTSRGTNEQGKYVIETFISCWYYNTQSNAYTYSFLRTTKTINKTKASLMSGNTILNPLGVSGNTIYLRKLLISNDVFLPDSVAYPGYPLNDIVPIVSFDHETISLDTRSTKTDVVGFSDGINRIPNYNNPILINTQDRELNKWSQVSENLEDLATLVSVNDPLIPNVIKGIKLESSHEDGTRTCLDNIDGGMYVFSAMIKGSGTIRCGYGYYANSSSRFVGTPYVNVNNDTYKIVAIPVYIPNEYIAEKEAAGNIPLDFYVYLSSAGGDITFCSPKLEMGNIGTGNPNKEQGSGSEIKTVKAENVTTSSGGNVKLSFTGNVIVLGGWSKRSDIIVMPFAVGGTSDTGNNEWWFHITDLSMASIASTTIEMFAIYIDV